jgi:Tol biopolymer transport system component
MSIKPRYTYIFNSLVLILLLSGCKEISKPKILQESVIVTPYTTIEQKTIITYTSMASLSMTPSITKELHLEGTLLLIAELDTNMGPRLYKLNADGSNLEMLSKNDIISVNYAEWSPNGKMIAFLPFSQAVDSHGFPDGEALKIVDSNGSGLKTLVSQGYLGGYSGYEDNISWSPDGTRLVYSNLMADNQGDIFLVWMDGSKKRLTNTAADEVNPKWISNNEVIYYSYNDMRKAEVFKQNVDSTENKLVQDIPEGYKIESLDTHCGKWILRKDEILYLKDIGENTIPQLITKISNRNQLNIKWSPDCNKLAYVSEVLVIYYLDQKRLIDLPSLGIGEPYWSPESDRIAYESSGNIYILNPDGSRNMRIFTAKGLYLMGWQPVPI